MNNWQSFEPSMTELTFTNGDIKKKLGIFLIWQMLFYQ